MHFLETLLQFFITCGILLIGWTVYKAILSNFFRKTKRNALLEITFYSLLCLLSLASIGFEALYIGQVGNSALGTFALTFLVSFFIFETIIKPKSRFTVIHHISLSLFALPLIFCGYFLALIPLLFLYELPGIIDVINVYFVRNRSQHKKNTYIIAIAVRLFTTCLIGPIVLGFVAYAMINYHDSGFIYWWNLIAVILSIGLNLHYSIKSIKYQMEKLRIIIGKNQKALCTRNQLSA